MDDDSGSVLLLALTVETKPTDDPVLLTNMIALGIETVLDGRRALVDRRGYCAESITTITVSQRARGREVVPVPLAAGIHS